MNTGFTVWLTGLSGAGKSTLALLLEARLKVQRIPVEVLDGDRVREILSRDLGYSREDRDENVRRIGFVSELLSRNGVAVIVAAISPYRSAREAVRARTPHFVEVHVDCPLDVLVQRDTKNLYRKALAGEVAHFTGISDPYEPPEYPEVAVRTDVETPEASVSHILAKLQAMALIPAL